MENNPALMRGIVGVVVVLGVAAMAFQMRGASLPQPAARAFFSIDDGKTWFADDAKKIPPFDKDGKQAVRAYVYRSEKGATFVNYLTRFTSDGKQALMDAMNPALAANKGKQTGGVGLDSIYTGGREVKKPGDAKWISGASYKDVAQATAIKCPDGSATATPVEP